MQQSLLYGTVQCGQPTYEVTVIIASSLNICGYDVSLCWLTSTVCAAQRGTPTLTQIVAWVFISDAILTIHYFPNTQKRETPVYILRQSQTGCNVVLDWVHCKFPVHQFHKDNNHQ